tara:strand:- start:373 stop:621 length:249 start_codon:yes stop_codon:yes gene_type:complete
MAYIDVDKVLLGYQDQNLSRPELILLAAKISRIKKVSGTEALRMIGNKEVDLDEVHEAIIQDYQEIKLPDESDEVDNDKVTS